MFALPAFLQRGPVVANTDTDVPSDMRAAIEANPRASAVFGTLCQPLERDWRAETNTLQARLDQANDKFRFDKTLLAKSLLDWDTQIQQALQDVELTDEVRLSFRVYPYSRSEFRRSLDNARHAQPALFVLLDALRKQLEALGHDVNLEMTPSSEESIPGDHWTDTYSVYHGATHVVLSLPESPFAASTATETDVPISN
jgi:hypothetical protein